MIWSIFLLAYYESGLIYLGSAWRDGFFTKTRHRAFPEDGEMRAVGFRYKYRGKPNVTLLNKPVVVKRNETRELGRFSLPESRTNPYAAEVSRSSHTLFGVDLYAEAGKPLRFELVYRHASVTDIEIIGEYR